MSTRAIVKFQWNGQTEAIIYKHCDGYPEHLGVELRKFVDLVRRSQANFLDSPGGMASRFCAYLLGIDPGDVVEVTPEAHGDEAYHYVVECKGATRAKPPAVRCYRANDKDQGDEVPMPEPKP